MKAPLEPLPPDIQKLLLEERPIPRQPVGARQRILGRAQASLRDPMLVGGISGVLASLWGTAAAKVATAGAVVTLGILGTTALVVRGSGSLSETSETDRQPTAANGLRSPAENTIAPADSPEPAVVPALPPQQTPPPSSVAAELTLLEKARASLANAQFEMALQVLSAHRRDFPRGRLVEEREGLRIRALIGQGRRADARKALHLFRGRFPRSVLFADMDAVLDTSSHSGAAARKR